MKKLLKKASDFWFEWIGKVVWVIFILILLYIFLSSTDYDKGYKDAYNHKLSTSDAFEMLKDLNVPREYRWGYLDGMTDSSCDYLEKSGQTQRYKEFGCIPGVKTRELRENLETRLKLEQQLKKLQNEREKNN